MKRDLIINNQEIMKQWHWEKNNALNIFPDKITCGSNKKAYFKCPINPQHYFFTRIDHVILDNTKCPICANQKIIIGVNDLQSTHPNLIQEWDFNKNINIKPTEVTYGKNIKVWWICKRNHSWSATIASRAGTQKTGCPICKKELFISFPEKVISFYLEQCCKIEENKNFTWLGNSELDIYLPEFNLAIEYDGQAWHKDYLRDLKKDILCDQNNIILFRIRENLCPVYESSSIKLKCEKQNYQELSNNINFIIDFINEKYNKNFKVNINIDRDYNIILEKLNLSIKANSISNSHLINEWNWKKNKGINPETIQLGTHKKFWWICKFGHEWKSAVYSRTSKFACGCPYCAGQKVISGWNDLATLYPNIIKEWNYDKNIISPNKIRPNTNKKYWWTCSTCNNEWESSPAHRIRGRSCPKCARQKTISSHYKKVLCVESNVIYNSVKEASIDTNIHQGSISNCCRGISKTAGGFHWEYIDNKKD